MFAKNRCRVASFSLRCLRLSKRFCKNSQNRCTLRLEFICQRKIGTTMTHIQIMLKCQLVELCVLFFKFWIMCAFTWYYCTWHLFHKSKLKAVAHLSSLSTWYSQADPGLQAPHHRCHPEMPGRGPALPSSCRARSAPRCESPRDASVHEQPGEPSGRAGEAGWGGAEVFGWREVTFLEGVSLRAFFCLAKAWGLDLFFSISRYYWVTFFERTNTKLTKSMPNLLRPPSKKLLVSYIYWVLFIYLLAFVSHTSWPCAHPRQNFMNV